MFGNLAMQVGSSMMSQGASKGQGVSKGGFNWGSLLQQGVGAMGTMANSSYATGGVTGDPTLRPNGTKKGKGFYGPLKTSTGKDMTEYSIGVEWDGAEHLLPTIAPGLSLKDKNYLLLNDGFGNDEKINKRITDNAIRYAQLRQKEGQPLFATEKEEGRLKFALGGITGKVPINAEGGEVIETPGGEPQELQGDSHAEGGIDLQVPEGTEIYSKRLKGPDGKSMADRKKARERQLAKLEKLAKSNPTDKTIRKTLEKTKKDFQIQEQQDMQKMQMMHQMTQMQQAMEHFATGGTAGKPLPVFNWMNWGKDWGNSFMPGESGGIPTGHDIVPFFNYGDDYGDPDGNKHPYGAAPTNNEDGVVTLSDADLEGKDTYGPMPKLNAGKSVAAMKGYYSDDEIADMGDDPNAKAGATGNKFGFLNKIFGEGSGLTMGDMIGLGGQLYSTFAPMKNTQANRAGDTPNINAFKDYGKDALHKMDQSKQYVNQVRDENLKDLELARTGQISRNRNSARGLNTQRALDLTADANVNDTKSKIFSQFAQAMQQIYGQEATLENDQDAHVMKGEYARDLADRQDRDNYFSQMAQDIATKGTGLQHIGKNVNEIKTRNVTGKLYNQVYSRYGVDAMTGDIKVKATKEIDSNKEFYENPKLHQSVADGLLKTSKYVRKGNQVFDRKGNEINIETGEVMKKEEDKKDTTQFNQDMVQEFMNYLNKKPSYIDKLGTHYK